MVEFLRFGWPANRLPGVPPLTINCLNHSSATRYPQTIDDYIQTEFLHDPIMGPFLVLPFQSGHVGVSPLSTRPKKNSHKRRVILHLSFPEGSSVNDWTPKDTYLGMNVSLSFPTVDDLAQRMDGLGQTCLLYKQDASRCFQWIPLDPHDFQLSGYL